MLGNHGNWEILSHVIVVSKLYTTSCQQGCSLIHTQTRNHVLTKMMMHKVTHCKGHVSADTRPHQLCWGTLVTGRCSLMSYLSLNYTLQAVNTQHVPPPILGPVMIHSLWSPMSQLLQMNDPCLRLDTTGCAPPLTSNTASSTTSGLV